MHVKLTSAQLRAARGLVNWTTRDLAEKTSVHRNTISAFESGKSEPNSATIQTLTRALESAGVIFVDENGEGPGVRLRKSMDKAHVTGRDGKSAYRITWDNKIILTTTGELFGELINNRIIGLDGVDYGGLDEFGKVPFAGATIVNKG